MSNQVQEVSVKPAREQKASPNLGKHRPVAALRIPLTVHLNKLLWSLSLLSGLPKHAVASLVLDGCFKIKKHRLRFPEAADQGRAGKAGPGVKKTRAHAIDDAPGMRQIDVLLSDKTLRMLENILNPQQSWCGQGGVPRVRGCISLGEAAALILLEATHRSVREAQMALETLYEERQRILTQAVPSPATEKETCV